MNELSELEKWIDENEQVFHTYDTDRESNDEGFAYISTERLFAKINDIRKQKEKWQDEIERRSTKRHNSFMIFCALISVAALGMMSLAISDLVHTVNYKTGQLHEYVIYFVILFALLIISIFGYQSKD